MVIVMMISIVGCAHDCSLFLASSWMRMFVLDAMHYFHLGMREIPLHSFAAVPESNII
jgi:hypothetical protein